MSTCRTDVYWCMSYHVTASIHEQHDAERDLYDDVQEYRHAQAWPSYGRTPRGGCVARLTLGQSGALERSCAGVLELKTLVWRHRCLRQDLARRH